MILLSILILFSYCWSLLFVAPYQITHYSLLNLLSTVCTISDTVCVFLLGVAALTACCGTVERTQLLPITLHHLHYTYSGHGSHSPVDYQPLSAHLQSILEPPVTRSSLPPASQHQNHHVRPYFRKQAPQTQSLIQTSKLTEPELGNSEISVPEQLIRISLIN